MKPARLSPEQAGGDTTAGTVPGEARRAKASRRHRAADGQVLVIFALSIFVFMGICAVVIDVSWYWANTLRVQRAADSAALAGVVDLPGDIPTAESTAVVAAKQNGYTVTNACKADGVTPSSVPGMCALPDPNNDRQLDVTLSEPVNTFFMRLIGINSITATRDAHAEYVVPVPMGSPQAYYGIYQLNCASGASGCPSGTNYNTIGAAPGDTGGAPASQGFFGAAIAQGGDAGNGDLVDPKTDQSGADSNPDYNANGYFYTVVIPSAGGAVYVFDPTFCVNGNNSASTAYGEGDHWVGSVTSNGMTTYYTLWNTNNLPLAPDRWTEVASSGQMFYKEFQSDQSGLYGSPGSGTGTNCAAGAITSATTGGYWHDKWWEVGQNVTAGSAGTFPVTSPTSSPGVATGLAAGTYELQVTTTDPTNATTNAENMFSIGVVDGGAAGTQVYGDGTMCNWYNIASGSSNLYLAQIPATYAGKTLQINLFDVGDTSANTYLKILSPEGGSQNAVAFTYSASTLEGTVKSSGSVPASGSGLETTSCSGSCTKYFNDLMLTMTVPLDTTYGSSGTGGLWNNGWWQVQYNVASANDTTTWAVDVVGNPVHLIVP